LKVPLVSASLFDRVDAVGVKGDMVLDRRYRLIRRFVGPHGVGGTIATGRNTEYEQSPL
jgi:hypothetical protein